MTGRPRFLFLACSAAAVLWLVAAIDGKAADVPSDAVLVLDGVAVFCRANGQVASGEQCPDGRIAAYQPLEADGNLQEQRLGWVEASRGKGTCKTKTISAVAGSVRNGPSRTVTVLSPDSKRYRELIAAAFGIPDVSRTPGFSVDQLVRVDLEADGVDEVVFSAQGAVGLRRVAGEQVETVLLPDPRPESDRLGIPRVRAFWDSDGDGAMEVIVHTGAPLAGLGPQWTGYWLVSARPPGRAPALLASSGCLVEGPPRPGPYD